MLKNLNKNYSKMNELIKKQLDLFNPKGDISKENLVKFKELDKKIDKIGEKVGKGLGLLRYARHNKSGLIYEVFNCKYSISAIQVVDGEKMSWEKFFSDYKAIEYNVEEDVRKGDLIVISAEANSKDVSLAENSEDGLASAFRVKEVLVDGVLVDGLRGDLGARVSKNSIFKVFNTIEDYNVWLNHIS